MASTKWFSNFMNVDNIGVSGRCPFCSSEDTDYCFVFTSSAIGGIIRNGFTEIWCNSCGKFDSMSCRNVPEENDFQVYTREEYAVHRLKWENGVYLPNIAVGELAVQTV